jgi:hypothetical protein
VKAAAAATIRISPSARNRVRLLEMADPRPSPPFSNRILFAALQLLLLGGPIVYGPPQSQRDDAGTYDAAFPKADALQARPAIYGQRGMARQKSLRTQCNVVQTKASWILRLRDGNARTGQDNEQVGGFRHRTVRLQQRGLLEVAVATTPWPGAPRTSCSPSEHPRAGRARQLPRCCLTAGLPNFAHSKKLPSCSHFKESGDGVGIC